MVSICIGKSEIQKFSYIKFLGAQLTHILSFKNHVRSKARTANYILHLFCNISKFITREVEEMLICNLIFPHQDYVNSILVNSPRTTLKPLQQVQFSAARLVLHKAKFHHAQIQLKELHWLPFQQRCIHKLLTIVWKTVHGQGQQYLHDKLKVKTITRTTRKASSVAVTL